MEINALGRLKMLFQRPYISKPYGGACHGALDGCRPPPPINLTLLRHYNYMNMYMYLFAVGTREITCE